jgi:hypothetical protein
VTNYLFSLGKKNGSKLSQKLLAGVFFKRIKFRGKKAAP